MVGRKFGLSRYTLDVFFDRVVERYAQRPAVAFVGEEPITYAALSERVRRIRQQLRQAGIRRGDRVALLGRSSPNWGATFLAVTTSGAVAVAIMDEFPETDVENILNHSEACALFIDEALYRSLSLPSARRLRAVISLDDFAVLHTAEARLDLQALPGRVRQVIGRSPAPEPPEPIAEDDLAEIIYTSGTTGHSKGVMLTHGNLVSNLFEGPDLLGVIDERSVILAILPMAHAFGGTSGFLSIIYRGACIYYLGRKPAPKVLLDAMAQVRPTIIGAVPLIFEKIYHKQVLPALQGHRATRLLARTRLGRRVLHRAAGRKLMKAMGGRLACAIIGGASLNREVEEFLREGGIPYALGYGLTECSPLVTFSAIYEGPLGAVGHAIDGVEIRIADPHPATGVGEILVKGPNVMKGYYKSEKETRQVFTPDGWFITGDRGRLDERGFLFIRGRSKNVIVGPSGENIYPEVIEDRLNGVPGVEESLVYEQEGRLVARVLPDYTFIRAALPGRDDETLGREVERLLETARQAVNAVQPPWARLARVIEQPVPFVKTPTNKIKRMEYVPGYE